MLRCTYRRLRRHMICPTDWPRPLWLRPLWLRPLWPRPLWLRPLWLRPLWPRPLWPFPQAPLAQAQTAGPFVSGPFGPGLYDSQRYIRTFFKKPYVFLNGILGSCKCFLSHVSCRLYLWNVLRLCIFSIQCVEVAISATMSAGSIGLHFYLVATQ